MQYSKKELRFHSFIIFITIFILVCSTIEIRAALLVFPLNFVRKRVLKFLDNINAIHSESNRRINAIIYPAISAPALVAWLFRMRDDTRPLFSPSFDKLNSEKLFQNVNQFTDFVMFDVFCMSVLLATTAYCVAIGKSIDSRK